MQKKVNLTPQQQGVFDEVLKLGGVASIFSVWAGAGLGKTTIIGALHEKLGGKRLDISDFVEAMQDRHPLALEESFARVVMNALDEAQTVLVDDLHLLHQVTLGNCRFPTYPRMKYFDAPMEMLCAYADKTGKKLIFAHDSHCPEPLTQRAFPFGIDKFSPEDYAAICAHWLRGKHEGLDYAKIHRFAPHLNAHQLRNSCVWFHDSEVTTEAFIEYLQSQQLVSNVDLGEVQAVELRDLKGVDDIIESLEANMILPLENEDLAARLDLKPKRGVLLAGPPGTGKTTIGRALAHRLKSKFFLVDGTFISGTGDFYSAISQVFERARNNAPSIIFIDDSDVIFESGEEHGLYRYLLTMLDGIESESMGRVCVMLTAMNVSNLPPALLRSGRVELWLEMRLPDTQARDAILHDRIGELPEELREVDFTALLEATEGFTGADLKRMIEDGKTLYAFDCSRQQPLQTMTSYFLRAIDGVLENKQRYAHADAAARHRDSSRPAWFDAMGMMAAMAGSPPEGSQAVSQ